jgi:hypothetical protein
MGILLAFAPFIVFAVVNGLAGATDGLVAAAAVAVALLVREAMTPGRIPKILEIGTAILFGGLALYAVLGGPTGSIMGVRLAVDAGLLLIVLVSIAIRQPFTLQYAREQVPREYWGHAVFIRTNNIITGAWAAAFGVLVVADLVLLYAPDVPPWVGVSATILALLAAVKFTGWYPARVRARGLIAPPG